MITTLNGIATVASIAGFLGWLWQVSQKRGTPLTRWGMFIVAAVLLILAGGGLALMNETPTVVPAPPTQTVMTSTQTTTHVEEKHVEPEQPPRKPPESTPAPPPPAHSVSISIVDQHGQPLPQLMSIVSDVLETQGFQPVATNGRFRATGNVTRTSTKESDAALQGLITAQLQLHLRVVDTTNGFVLTSSDFDSRGGGFTADAAETQAIERLGTKLRAMLGHREKS